MFLLTHQRRGSTSPSCTLYGSPSINRPPRTVLEDVRCGASDGAADVAVIPSHRRGTDGRLGLAAPSDSTLWGNASERK